MPKITVIGELIKPEAKKKPIEFNKYVDAAGDFKLSDTMTIPSRCDNIELICKDFYREGEEKYDLIFVYDGNNRNNYCSSNLYLGKWNDGVVE